MVKALFVDQIGNGAIFLVWSVWFPCLLTNQVMKLVKRIDKSFKWSSVHVLAAPSRYCPQTTACIIHTSTVSSSIISTHGSVLKITYSIWLQTQLQVPCLLYPLSTPLQLNVLNRIIIIYTDKGGYLLSDW